MAGRAAGWQPRSDSRGSLGLFGAFLRLVLVHFLRGRVSGQASVQTEGHFEAWPLQESGFLEAMSLQKFSVLHHRSTSIPRMGARPIQFEPSVLDFHEQPVGMPKLESVHLHNPSADETVTLLSISATTSHFHASFFQNRVIPPGGNTSFDVVFLARVVGNVENTLFINTSRHGAFTYQVFGVGVPNPYRLRPFLGARVPVNSSFSPLINMHNPHSKPLQVVEIYSTGGDLHLELPTGQAEGPRKLWEIPPFETKAVMRASFISREPHNHTAFIRIKTNDSDDYLILPMEVEVTTAPGIYSSTEMLDFGTLRSQDPAKTLNLYLLNSGAKDVPITNIKLSPANTAISIDFKPLTLKAFEKKYTKVASVIYDPSKARRISQHSGKILVKAKEKSYPKLEIAYQVDLLEGYLGYDQAATLFQTYDGQIEPQTRPVSLTNTFNITIVLHDVTLPEEVQHLFQVKNFSRPLWIAPQETCYAFSLSFAPVGPLTNLEANVLLSTNASRFHLPFHVYTGFVDYLVLPPSLEGTSFDFGVLAVSDVAKAFLLIFNSNPIKLDLKSWEVIGERLSVELLSVAMGNLSHAKTTAELDGNRLDPQPASIQLLPGHHAVFCVTLHAAQQQGDYEAAVRLTTDCEILTIPVKAVVAVGTLVSQPQHILLSPSFPGKLVVHPVSLASSFSRGVRVEAVRPPTNSSYFFFRRLRHAKEELEPGKTSKIGNIYFNASAVCDGECYIGAGARWLDVLRKETVELDSQLYRELQQRWASLRDKGLLRPEGTFEVNTDIFKSVAVRVTAQLTWPSLINKSQRLLSFPLTSRNTTTVEQLLLENPTDVPVSCQVLSLRWHPSPASVIKLLSDRLNLDMYHIEETEAFLVMPDSKLASEWLGVPSAVQGLRLDLPPGEQRVVSLGFAPTNNLTISSLVLIRNNLTILDGIVVSGQGVSESLRLGGKVPSPNSSLRFKVTESFLRDCTDKSRSKQPNFTLTRTFKMENPGPLDLRVMSIAVNDYSCEGYGFHVLNCEAFTLKANSSREFSIAFTPDFTASRVIRELRVRTARDSEFSFVLNASLPYHMLATCSEALPRPNWEGLLYIAVFSLVSAALVGVLLGAYLEGQALWENFRAQLQAEAASSLCEDLADRPFDLRKISAGLGHDHSTVDLVTPSGSTRSKGTISSGGLTQRHGGSSSKHHPNQQHNQHHQHNQQQHTHHLNHQNQQHGAPGRPQTDHDGGKARSSSGSSNNRGSPQSGTIRGHYHSSLSPDQSVTQNGSKCQNKRGQTKGSQHSNGSPGRSSSSSSCSGGVTESQPLTTTEEGPTENPVLEFCSYVPVSEVASITDDSQALLLGEMDGEEPLHVRRNQGKGSVRRARKEQRRRDEKERRESDCARLREEEQRDGLADNDDSSSTTTEASNPDLELAARTDAVKVVEDAPPVPPKHCGEDLVETSSKAFPRKTSVVRRKELGNSQPETNSTELFHTHMSDFRTYKKETKAAMVPVRADLSDKARRNSNGKLRPKGNLVMKTAVQPMVVKVGKESPPLGFELDMSRNMSRANSSSEGEKDALVEPEWDLPLTKHHGSTDSLHQLSLQTLKAEPFLNRHSNRSPDSNASSPSPAPYGQSVTYSSVVASSSESSIRNMSCGKAKLAKILSLPGRNGNPTFAAVAAGHDKTFGPEEPFKAILEKANSTGSLKLSEPYGYGDGIIKVDSDLASVDPCVASVYKTSPPAPSPTFSAFGPSNSFDLTGEVFGPRVRSGSGQRDLDATRDWPPSFLSPWIQSQPLPRNTWSSGSVPTSPTSSPFLQLGVQSTVWSHPFNSIWSVPCDRAPFGMPCPVTPVPGTPITPTSCSVIRGSGGSNHLPMTSPIQQGGIYNPFDCIELDMIWRPSPVRQHSVQQPWHGDSM